VSPLLLLYLPLFHITAFPFLHAHALSGRGLGSAGIHHAPLSHRLLIDSRQWHPYTEAVRLTPKQREYVAKYLLDISKLAFAGIVVGKFVSPNPIPIWVFGLGLAFSAGTLIPAIVLDK